MEPNDLKTPELRFELRSRGIEPKENQQLRRAQFRGVLAQEREGTSFPQVSPNSFEDEESEIMDTLNELIDIVSHDQVLTDLEIRRVDSRLQHVRRRCSLLKADNEAHKAKLSSFESYILIITGFLIEQKDNSVTNPFLSSTVRTEVVSTTPAVTTYAKALSLNKWGLTFLGHSAKESVMSFLEKVQELCEARQVSHQQLFTSAVDLFSGPALVWYRNIKKQVTSWSDLVACLKRDFLPVDYEDDLLAEIRSRTQGLDENVLFYIIAVEALFGRLSSPPSDKDIIKQIKRNLNPYFAERLALTETSSLSDLKDKCRALQEIKIRTDRYRPPPMKKKALLEPDLAYLSLHEFKSSEPSTSKVSHDFIESVLCWNCDSSGHSFRDCSAPRSIFCHRCGAKGKYVSSCPNCNPKNLNTGAVPRTTQQNRSVPVNQRSPNPNPVTPLPNPTVQPSPPPRAAKFVPSLNKPKTNSPNQKRTP